MSVARADDPISLAIQSREACVTVVAWSSLLEAVDRIPGYFFNQPSSTPWSDGFAWLEETSNSKGKEGKMVTFPSSFAPSATAGWPGLASRVLFLEAKVDDLQRSAQKARNGTCHVDDV